MRQEILEKLKALSEENYKEFNFKLIPGVNKERTLGVRLPDIRKLAKEIAKGDFRAYLEELENAKPDPQGVGGTELYYEEVQLQGIIIGTAKMDTAERLGYIERFVPRIDNWAICDTCCGMKFADKDENRQIVWDFLQPYVKDHREFFIRFGVIMILSHYIDEEHIDAVLEIMDEISHDGYYVKMGVAWTLSVCYVKFPEKTEALIGENNLDDFTHNKTIQKIRESYRVSKEDKERLNEMKRR